ncbi:MAG: hypothetical protein FWG31_02735 [Oscillospiraceae bacterium]|nr:hypothetical protein [Oscillospiraceae bacterium]
MAYPNGIAELYTYDAAGQLLELTQVNPDGTSELLNRYAYDPVGNVVSIDGFGANNIKFELSSSTYNEMNQLTSKTVRNMTGKLLNDITYTYDKRGNLIEEEDAREWTTKTYEYDGTNRMVRGINGYGDESEYVYNGLGFLVQHIGTAWRGTIVTDYVIDYTRIVDTNLAAYGSDGIDYRYTYGTGLSKIAVNVTSPTDTLKLYIQNDRLGSSRFATNPAGIRAAYTSLDEWGNVFVSMKVKLNGVDLKVLDNFTNHDYDEILGIYYAKARFYDPAVQRFLAVDPARDGFNWYAYANNNPVKFFDPFGLCYHTAPYNENYNFLCTVCAGMRTDNTLNGWTPYMRPEGMPPPLYTPYLPGSGLFEPTFMRPSPYDVYFSQYGCENEKVSFEEFMILFAKSGYNPDPYARPGQKKQGREKKEKKKENPEWKPRGGKRQVTPPKKHTPSKDHQKYPQKIEPLMPEPSRGDLDEFEYKGGGTDIDWGQIATDAGKVVAGAGATYVTYRLIRLLPSLFPPLWPTIPANLAIP